MNKEPTAGELAQARHMAEHERLSQEVRMESGFAEGVPPEGAGLLARIKARRAAERAARAPAGGFEPEEVPDTKWPPDR